MSWNLSYEVYEIKLLNWTNQDLDWDNAKCSIVSFKGGGSKDELIEYDNRVQLNPNIIVYQYINDKFSGSAEILPIDQIRNVVDNPSMTFGSTKMYRNLYWKCEVSIINDGNEQNIKYALRFNYKNGGWQENI